jgi:hypothetical protein
MNSFTLQDTPAFSGHSPEQERPLGSYALVTGTFLSLASGFAAWLCHSGSSPSASTLRISSSSRWPPTRARG